LPQAYQTNITQRSPRLAARGSTPVRVCVDTWQDLASKTAWCRVSWRQVCCLL
jgi:hypothetical protein